MKKCCPPGYQHPPGCEDCDDCFTIDPEDCKCPSKQELDKGIKDSADAYAHSWNEFGLELNHELCCCAEFDLSGPCHRLVKCHKIDGEAEATGKMVLSWFHIPYFPAFHRPGWLLRYLVGPFNKQLLNSLVADFCAGLTVALTLIPQALSYAKLANLPAINGLYAAILPSATYVFFGSSMQLAVGPVAIVSLLTGQIVAKYQPDFATNFVGATDTAAQASLSVGIIMTCMGLLNLGSFIQFISFPVMSGFTTGAAMSIGLSQIKSAFGFATQPANAMGYTDLTGPPQQGQVGYDYNYAVMAWYTKNWNAVLSPMSGLSAANLKKVNTILQGSPMARNPISTAICFGIFVPLTLVNYLKSNVFKGTKERKKRWSFWAFNIITSLFPFCCLIIATAASLNIKQNQDFYSNTLNIVGPVTAGLNILRTPNIHHNFGDFFADCIPIALVLFMESYAVARRIASNCNELHLLNPSQELFANGVANLLGSISTAQPVAGSFSRSSLNYTVGAKTPLSKLITLCIVLLVLSVLTQTFYFIPNPALSAIIWVSISSLIDFTDLWEAWKHSKKDWFVMLVTLSLTFTTDTAIGLAVGIGLSVLINLAELAFSPNSAPFAFYTNTEDGIEEVHLQGDVTFIQSSRLKEFISNLFMMETPEPGEDASASDKAYYKCSTGMDCVFRPRINGGQLREVLPRALILDFTSVVVIDVTGLMTLTELCRETRQLGVLVVIVKSRPHITRAMAKFGLYNDSSTAEVNLDRFILASDLPEKANAIHSYDQYKGPKDKDPKEQYWSDNFATVPGPSHPHDTARSTVEIVSQSTPAPVGTVQLSDIQRAELGEYVRA